ncbi:Sodium/hydrogen exchanger 5, partial [Dissostichus eleginoides]
MASRASFPEVTNVTNYLRENGSGVCLDLQVIDNVPGGQSGGGQRDASLPRRKPYQSHYSRHFMPLGEKERQDREVFQRNMKIRMETFKSSRHKLCSASQRRGSDSKEEGGDKPRRNVSWQDKNPVVVPVESDAEHSDAEKEEDVGITFIARKPETPKPRPKSVPAALEGCESPPPAAPPSPPSLLPWKGGVGSPPPCVSMEATKIIPVDLQRAWNQSISSLESISSPPTPLEPLHPRVSALSRLGGPRPASYTPPGSSASYDPPGGSSASPIATPEDLLLLDGGMLEETSTNKTQCSQRGPEAALWSSSGPSVPREDLKQLCGLHQDPVFPERTEAALWSSSGPSVPREDLKQLCGLHQDPV